MALSYVRGLFLRATLAATAPRSAVAELGVVRRFPRHLRMNQRYGQLLIAVLLLCSVLPGLAADACPDCGGKLTKVGNVADDPTKPSKNISVWNRSICANMFYGDDSLICTRCWLSYSKQFQRWERSSELPDSFRRPLSPAIRGFPVPPAKNIKSLVVYSQQITGAQMSESVAFWCSDSADLIAGFRAYARKHGLSIRVEMQGHVPKQIYVAIETKPSA